VEKSGEIKTSHNISYNVSILRNKNGETGKMNKRENQIEDNQCNEGRDEKLKKYSFAWWFDKLFIWVTLPLAFLSPLEYFFIPFNWFAEKKNVKGLVITGIIFVMFIALIIWSITRSKGGLKFENQI
jgi:hypothetical protein